MIYIYVNIKMSICEGCEDKHEVEGGGGERDLVKRQMKQV